MREYFNVSSREVDESASSQGPYQMTSEILKQKYEHTNPGRAVTQLYAGAAASVSSISFGAVLGWSSPTIRQILDNSEGHLIVNAKLTLLASLAPLGCAIGTIVWSYFNIKFGPRKALLIQSPLLLATWLALAFYTNTNVAVAGRFFCGFFAIASRISSETLLFDAVHKKYLSYVIVPYKSFVALGILITYILGYTISDTTFSLCNCGIVLINFIMIFFCPESPVFLYDKSITKAEAALSWYRGRDNIYIEMRSIKKNADQRKLDPDSYKYMLFSRVVVKAMIIVFGVSVAHVFSGYHMFLFYNIAVVRKYSDDNVTELIGSLLTERSDAISKNVDSMILGLTMFVSSFFSTLFHYRMILGIRKPLLVSCFLTFVNLLFIVVFLILRHVQIRQEKNDLAQFDIKQQRWIYLVLVNTLVVCHEIGLSTCGDIMLLEYVPKEVYPRARIIIKLGQWLLIYIVIRTYFMVQYIVNGWGLMGIQAAIVFTIFILANIFVIESKDKTLLQIQTALGGNPVGTTSITARHEERQSRAMAL